MKRVPISTRRMTFVLLLIVLAFTLLACNFLIPLLSQGNGPAASQTSTGSEENQPIQPAQPTQPAIPDGWKLSKDLSGTCQVATPPEWELGTDFFLAVEEPDPGPFEDVPGQYPPSGLALWGGGEGTPVPVGHHFQIRASRVFDEQVCSVWRIKAEVDFTDAEKTELEQVGATLQEVH
ncbi:MAG: hypothetical protein MUO64_17720 [Anaerolineales bacterium]|nr:hypothetical protein [Anaerolineales bacterium]